MTEKAHEFAIELTDDNESISDVVNAKLVTKDGTIPNPFNLHSDWSSDFSDAPNFAWGDLYCYLINKKGYDQESLKAYKSLEGYRLHWDGHVYNLQRNKNSYFEHHIIKFSVKPTEREKTFTFTFTKPEIGEKKKKAVKPSTRNSDPRSKAV